MIVDLTELANSRPASVSEPVWQEFMAQRLQASANKAGAHLAGQEFAQTRAVVDVATTDVTPADLMILMERSKVQAAQSGYIGLSATGSSHSPIGFR